MPFGAWKTENSGRENGKSMCFRRVYQLTDAIPLSGCVCACGIMLITAVDLGQLDSLEITSFGRRHINQTAPSDSGGGESICVARNLNCRPTKTQHLSQL